MIEPMSMPPPAAAPAAQHAKKLATKAAAQNAGNRIAQRAKVQVLQNRARRVAANCARDQLDDQIHIHVLIPFPNGLRVAAQASVQALGHMGMRPDRGNSAGSLTLWQRLRELTQGQSRAPCFRSRAF